jgi:hypothetical protein
MARIVAENTSLTPALDPAVTVHYRNPDGDITRLGGEYPELEEWDCCPAEVDSMFWDALGVDFYEYIDRDVHNGLFYFYSVTATDFNAAIDLNTGALVNLGPGLVGDPQSNFDFATPRPHAQSAKERAELGQNIYVVPNPATRESLSKFSQLNPNGDDPTGVRVMFSNLPRSKNTVKIFTLAGDLVETIDHDGTNGDGAAFWNLVSRNGQEVVSGIYLYSIESNDSAFERVVGRFVVIR